MRLSLTGSQANPKLWKLSGTLKCGKVDKQADIRGEESIQSKYINVQYILKDFKIIIVQCRGTGNMSSS